MNLNIYTPIGNNLGYGIAGLNITRELIRMGEPISLFPIGGIQVQNDDRYNNELQKGIDNANFFDVNAPCVKIWHQFAMADMIGRGQRIGFPIFELNKFSDLEKHHLRSCDLLLVCSKWAKNIIEENGIHVPTKVVPLGVDTSIFFPRIRFTRHAGCSFSSQNYQEVYAPNSTYIFINVGKWEIRKGHDILIEAFNKAFTKNDNVQLWMAPDNPFLNANQRRSWEDLYLKSTLGSKIKIFPRQLTQADVSSIIRQANCGVFPARGEGWNLDALECMACGLDTIVTNYAAHTEFCDKTTSSLIDIDELEPAFDGIWFHGQGEWGKFGDKQLEQLITFMQNKYNNYCFPKNGIERAKELSWRNSAECLLNSLK